MQLEVITIYIIQIPIIAFFFMAAYHDTWWRSSHSIQNHKYLWCGGWWNVLLLRRWLSCKICNIDMSIWSTELRTNSMDQSPYWNSYIRSVDWTNPIPSSRPKVHTLLKKTLILIINQVSLAQTFLASVLKLILILFFHLANGLFHLSFKLQCCMHSHLSYAPRPPFEFISIIIFGEE